MQPPKGLIQNTLRCRMAILGLPVFLLSFLAMVILAPVSLSQEDDQISAPNEIDLVLEGNLLKIELYLTGAETVGFVNAPQSRDQEAAVDDALRKLSDIRRLFAFPQVAGCELDYFETEADPFATAEEFLKLRANYRFMCKSPRSLNRIKLLCFEKFTDLSEVKASAKGHWGEFTTLVTPANAMLQLIKKK